MTTQLLLKLYKVSGYDHTSVIYATGEIEAQQLHEEETGVLPETVELVPFERGVILVDHP